jgi:hypothetical protein
MLKTETNLPTAPGDNSIETRAPQMGERAEQKIFLPQQSGESRFAPPQYYYEASKSGAVPSWAIAGDRRSRKATPPNSQMS